MKSVVVSGLKYVFGSDHGSVLYECRRCGANLGCETDTCPQCGGKDIACYQLD
jgi:ribosomal protein L37E